MRARAERGDEVIGEGLDGRVADGGAAAEREHVVADRMQQVGLAEPGRRVDEQRVVRLARELGDRQRRRVREAVAVADDELVEAVAGVERDGGVAPRGCRGDALAPLRQRTRAAVVTGLELDACLSPEHRLRRAFEDAAEAPVEPRLGGCRTGQHEHAPIPRPRLERRQPDLVIGVADGPTKVARMSRQAGIGSG